MNVMPSDHAWIERVAASDPEAVRVLWDRYGDFVYSVAFRTLGRAADAEDATQNAWMEILRDAGKYRGEGSVRAWIARIAVHSARKVLRGQERAWARDRKAARPEALPIEDGLESRELQARLEAVVRGLPDAEREVVLLHYYQGLSQQEVAEAVDCPVGTVKSRLHQALELLRAKAAGSGIALSGVALVSVMQATPAHAAPASLAASLVAGAGTAAGFVEQGIHLGGMTMKGKAIAAGAILALGCTAGIGTQRLRSEETALRAVNMRLKALVKTRVAPEPEDGSADLVRLQAKNRELQERLEVKQAPPSDAAAQRLEAVAATLSGIQGKADAETLRQAITTLMEEGQAALPLIDRLLEEGRDVILEGGATPEPFYASYPTLRVALLQALKRVGGPQAKDLALQHLGDSRNALEVHEVGRILLQEGDEIAWHRDALVSALRNTLDGPETRRELALRRKDYQEKTAEGPNNPRHIYSYGLERDLIASLGATPDLVTAIEANLTAEPGCGDTHLTLLLATGLPADQAAEVLLRIRENRRRENQPCGHILRGMGAINSPETFAHLLRLYPDLDRDERSDLLIGVTDGLQSRRLGFYNTLAAGWTKTWGNYVKGREPTAEMGQRALAFLKAVQDATPGGSDGP